MLTIAITGSTGLIGTRLIELLNKDFQFIEILQQEVDITDKDSLWNKIKSIDFDIFFHMAAYTNVDGAEKEKKLVYAINVEGTKNIFDMVLQKNRKMIYVSTDFVFDGSSPPYYEDSKPNPIGYYAQTKYKGEMMVKDR
ncbi:dTDP-4-dehydrorhamnose reductase, partial [Candidatus Roizmanbacteria bacterium CG09_land_8_20_14_0_10_41_9]